MKKFILAAKLNEDTKTYEVANFNEFKSIATEYVNKLPKNMIISSSDDIKAVKNARTDTNYLIKYISSERKSIERIYLGKFKTECMEVEKILQAGSDELTRILNEAQGTKPLETFKITCSSEDEKVIAKVTAYAMELGCKVK